MQGEEQPIIIGGGGDGGRQEASSAEDKAKEAERLRQEHELSEKLVEELRREEDGAVPPNAFEGIVPGVPRPSAFSASSEVPLSSSS